jgi:Immunoglobulin-like domain of bacterial spore germination/Sporulation and spore germination
MTSERRTVVVVVLMLLGAGGVGVAAGALMGRSDRGAQSSAQDVLGAGPGAARTPVAVPTPSDRAVPVYALGPTAAGPRLYREFRASAAADPVEGAVAGLAVAPSDPDYRSPWLGLPARVSRSGTTATVTFDRAPALAGATAQLAAQQVVYTVTAADPRIRAVRVVAPGLPAAVATGRAAAAGVMAPVWLLDPVDGGSAGSRLTVSGTASVLAAAVGVEVRRGGEVLARAAATASAGAPGRGEWTATLSVPPGSYVVAAFERSAKDGVEAAVDTKRVTVSGR